MSIGAHNRIDVRYALGIEGKPAEHAAYCLTEDLLGEALLDRWIGVISADLDTDGMRLDELQPRTEALIGELRDALPTEPMYRTPVDGDWQLFKGEPEDRRDYPDQTDMFVGTAMDGTLWVAARCGVPFYAERFSRCGESFCFVKLDGHDIRDMTFEDAAAISHALDAALRDAGIGGFIGGATGLRYAYFDVALTDLAAGIETIRDVLRAGRVPQRSWIQFYEADLGAEWIGIHDDTPAPPGLRY